MFRIARALEGLAGTRCSEAGLDGRHLRIRFDEATIGIACARRIEGGTAASLVGRSLRAASLADGGDLTLSFEGGLQVVVFCDGRAASATRHWALTHAETGWEARPDGFARTGPEGERIVDETNKAELLNALALLEGRPCWCVVPAGPHGAVQLAFGLQLPREFELQVDGFPELFRTHAPELGLHLECAWRLDGASGVVCAARDALVLDGRLARGTARLVGRSAEAVKLVSPAGDLEVHFGDGLVLRVFADRVAADRGEDNWTLSIPGEVLTVGPGGLVRRELVADRPSLRVVR